MPGAQHPQAGLPLRSVLAGAALQRQHETRRLSQTALEDAAQALALLRIVQLVVHRIDVDRELALFEQICQRIFVGGHQILRIKRQPARQRFGEDAAPRPRRKP